MATDTQHLLMCFDLGGVVVRHCRSWEEGCASAGLDVREPDRLNTPELRARRRALNDAHQRGQLDHPTFWQAIAQATEHLYTVEEVERLHHAWLLDEYEGVAEIVRELDASDHLTTACLSNTNVPHWELSTRYNGGPLSAVEAVIHMEHRLVSHELGTAKPDAKIYELTERATGFAPDTIVFFDDLIENIDAASSRGWRAHHIDHESCPATQIRTALSEMGIELSAHSGS